MSSEQKTLAKPESLAKILVKLGVITEDQLEEALSRCDSNQRNLLFTIAQLGYAEEKKLLKAVSVQLQVPYFTSFQGLIDLEAAKLIPQKMARKYLVLPLRKVKKGLMLAMVNPVDIFAIDTVAAHTEMKILPVLTTRANLFEWIQKVHQGDEPAASPEEAAPAKTSPEASAAPAASIKIVPRGFEAPMLRLGAEDSSVIEVVDGIIGDAVASRCSDIHLEPAANSLRVRLRIDGMLRERRAFPKDLEPSIVARIKILSLLDITEVRLPQDGHIAVDYGGSNIDLRVSTLPTIYGEKVVIRVLDQATSRRTLADLGLPKGIHDSFNKVIRAPMGLLLVTGPTGSGKTTTLYGALNEINSEEKNIVTLEDPVEYRLPGLNQVEVNHHIGFTFATGLRSILRQDPNVILVGEIRDLETAEIAIQASNTGHFVLSTLHTKDTVHTVSRLVNMKLEPYLLSSALTGILAQRLVRVLCEQCKKLQPASERESSLLGVPLKQKGPFYGPVGCDACMGLGYRGRKGVYEWLVVNRDLRTLILANASADALKEVAKKDGMVTLQESGLDLVYKGVTSLGEVVRVTHEEEFEQAKQDQES